MLPADTGLSKKLIQNVREARKCVLNVTLQGKIIRKDGEKNRGSRVFCSKGRGEEDSFSEGPDDQYLSRTLRPQSHCKTMQSRNSPHALLNSVLDTAVDNILPPRKCRGCVKRTVVKNVKNLGKELAKAQLQRMKEMWD